MGRDCRPNPVNPAYRPDPPWDEGEPTPFFEERAPQSCGGARRGPDSGDLGGFSVFPGYFLAFP